MRDGKTGEPEAREKSRGMLSSRQGRATAVRKSQQLPMSALTGSPQEWAHLYLGTELGGVKGTYPSQPNFMERESHCFQLTPPGPNGQYQPVATHRPSVITKQRVTNVGKGVGGVLIGMGGR